MRSVGHVRAESPDVTLVMPTRDRPDRLRSTLLAIDAVLGAHDAGRRVEIVVADDASIDDVVPSLPPRLTCGAPVTGVRLPASRGAAARTDAVQVARAPWILMLDDDSWPLDAVFLDVAESAAPDVVAIGLDIHLAAGRRESGGLPEVPVGCGVLVRQAPYLELGGYDASFHYYVEEYDFAARAIAAGWRLQHDLRSRIRHAKVAGNRDMNRILARLVRNNGWVMARWAPEAVRESAIEHLIDRYGRIADREDARDGWRQGVAEFEATRAAQSATPLTDAQWERFIGRRAVAETVERRTAESGASPWRWAIDGTGKHVEVLRSVLEARSGAIEVAAGDPAADAVFPGSLSPGPMLDGFDAIAGRGDAAALPWRPEGWDGTPRPRPRVRSVVEARPAAAEAEATH